MKTYCGESAQSGILLDTLEGNLTVFLSHLPWDPTVLPFNFSSSPIILPAVMFIVISSTFSLQLSLSPTLKPDLIQLQRIN